MEIQDFSSALLLIAGLGVICFFLYLLIRISAQHIFWMLYRKYALKLEFRRIGLFYIKDIHILLRDGTTVEIEKIWLSSNLFHYNFKTLLVICISDVRLQGDSNLNRPLTKEKSYDEKKKSFWLIKLLSLSNYLSVQAYNVSIMKLGAPQEEFLLHISLQEVFMSFRTTKVFWLDCSIVSSSIKVFKHLPFNQEQSRSESCLGHLSTNVDLKIEVSSVTESLFHSLAMTVMKPELILYEGFSINALRRPEPKKCQSALFDEDPNQNSSNGINDDVATQGESEDKIKVPKLFKKLPFEIMFRVDSFCLKSMKDGGHKAFTMGVNCIEAGFNRNEHSEEINELSCSFSFCIQEVTAATSHVQFSQMSRIVFCLQIKHHAIISKLQVSSLNFWYDQEIFQYWLGVIPVNSRETHDTETGVNKQSSNVLDVFDGFHFQHTTKLSDISVSAKLPGCRAFSTSLMHCHLSFSDYILYFAKDKLFFQESYIKDIGLEILVETLYIKLGEECLPDNSVVKRYHIWNVPASVGMFLIKAKFHATDYTVNCMADNVQFEWSPMFSTLATDIFLYMKTTPLDSKQASMTDNKKKTDIFAHLNSQQNKNIVLQLNITAINIFCLSEIRNAIVLRIDFLNLDNQARKVKVDIDSFKLSTTLVSSTPYLCVKSSEIKLFVANISQSCIMYDFSRKDVSIEFSEEIQTLWSTTFHMAALTVFQDIKALQSQMKSKMTDNFSDNLDKEQSIMNTTFIKIQGDISIGMVLSASHGVVFSAEEISLTVDQNTKSAHADCLVVCFDNNPVFTFKEFTLALMQGNEQHVYSRRSFDNLDLANNRLLNVHIEEFKLIFPYKYDFAQAFNEEFLGIVKWLKQMHKSNKSLDHLLPSDLSIKTKLWTIELQDDPFEVKLRDNFELLEDEYHESLKRTNILDEKIESLQKTNPLLPGEKITELYSKLAKKNAEIYVLRSQQLYQQSPMRTSVALCQLEDIEILAIADTSYHGPENVVSCMKQLNMESPYPDEVIEYNTVWGRKVRCSTLSWTCSLRDFPQPLLSIKGLHVWGFLIGAEQEGSHRAKRNTTIEIGEPWSNATVERNMPPLKFYHDLTFDIEDMCMSYGPCWEPPMSQFSLSMDLISKPSLDPSPSLPWWDKMRLLYHGHLTYSIQHLTLLMRASLDPYNTTEQMELTWSDVIIDYTTGKILTKGDLDVYVHTASKYDDCRVLHIPSLKLSINLDWLCLGNPYDHHSVTPCAPDKIPEYSINQEHDSYRAFRSQNLTILYSFEAKAGNNETDDFPSMILYSSTLRWIENLKMIMAGVTRLTRRGKLFGNSTPRKPQLGRHYRNLRLSLNVHKFHIFYWMSFAKRQGLQLIGSQLALSSENTLSLIRVNDGLKHRPSASWSISYLNCELCDIEIWLYDWLQADATENTAESFQAPVERSYFLSVNRVSYGREEVVKDVRNEDRSDTPTHRLVVHDLKGAWTKHNRNVVFCLYDSYMKSVLLKKNLSTDALRGFKVESQNTPQKLRTQTSTQNVGANLSLITSLQTGQAVSMLQKLISEAEASSIVFTEELEGSTREQLLHGVAACQTDDVLQKKWLIELVNSQVMMRGCETSGYVIVSAAKAQILQRIHRPVWKDRSLVSKTTWVVSFECMQYYATVDVGEPSPSMDNIMWLSVDNIDGRESMVISDLADLVGSGHSVGGVVSNTVGAVAESGSAPIQLQRIVSRCGCQFFYASYGENIDPSSLEEVPPLPENIDIWEPEVAVDSFTLTHHDLEICTNSLQYAMILDLVNNLLLYVEPRKKEANKKLQYMRFQFQLSSLNDQKEPILKLQEKVRSLVSKLRRLEKEAYVVHRVLSENPGREDVLVKLQELENDIYNCKEELNTMNEELTTMICCFKEMQIIASKSRQRATSQEKGISVSRRAEVCFKHAQWALTDADGQLGIADLLLSNFLYSKVNKSDESIEHLLEVGYVKVMNLLPNQLYKHVLEPTDVHTSIPLDRQCMLRIYCRERPPVAGISVKEHLELNVIPFTLCLTDAFYKAMLKFFFPDRDTDKDDHQEGQEQAILPKKKDTSEKRYSIFYSDRDEIEKMKERADKNHTFYYIKIPEVPLKVSYKGKKEKNIEDVHNLSLVLATLEYHNRTWTWLDLLMELKNDAKKTLIHQAIKQTLLAKRGVTLEKDKEPEEEEKASILFGARHANTPERSSKRRFFSLPRKDMN